MLKDIITHYFFLLGENPNLLAEEIPSNYEERCLDDLTFIPPPMTLFFLTGPLLLRLMAVMKYPVFHQADHHHL